MRTVNYVCLLACTETFEHVCVRLHIHPNLHTVYVCVSLGGGGRVFVCVRACRRFCECEGIVFECV